MLDQNFDFLKYNGSKPCYKVNATFLRYYGVVCALAKLKKSFQEQATMNSEDQLTRSQKLLSPSSFCKEAYQLIAVVNGITSTTDKSQSK